MRACLYVVCIHMYMSLLCMPAGAAPRHIYLPGTAKLGRKHTAAQMQHPSASSKGTWCARALCCGEEGGCWLYIVVCWLLVWCCNVCALCRNAGDVRVPNVQ